MYRSKLNTVKIKLPARRTLFKQGQEILQTCRELVTAHEDANDRDLAQPNLRLAEMRTTWTEDVAQIEKILLYGRQYGENIVKLNVSLSSDVEDRTRLLLPPQDALDEAGEIAREMHQRSTDMLDCTSHSCCEINVAYL
ncbi:hypothetical protein BD289DRAFT_433039 [Coniella lustricola]|uniref:Uncharacterized protein n=1 Tax=Coniella lustricola TaxID=2025994 RepID=A0A2T3A984_9PEZI|nr:hypothetical protein BD289DRAFT_433039 [Coniella lustricola]